MLCALQPASPRSLGAYTLCSLTGYPGQQPSCVPCSQPPRGLWAPILSAPFSQGTLPLCVLTRLLLLYRALVLAET